MSDYGLMLISCLVTGLVFGVVIYIGYFIDKRNRKRDKMRKLGVGGNQAKSLIK